MAGLQFTEDEIRQQLQMLGYENIPRRRLAQFAKDLEKLIEEDKLPTTSDDPHYSDLSDHPDVSGHRSPDMPSDVSHDTSAGRSPFNEVPRDYYSSRHTAPSSKSTLKQSRYDQENQVAHYVTTSKAEGSLPSPEVKQRSSGVTEGSKLYDAYQRRDRRTGAPTSKTVAMKRKVVRKRDGHSQIFDESVTESESDMSYLNERLEGLPLRGEVVEEAESETSSVGAFSSFRRHVGRPNTSQGLYPHRPSGDEDSTFNPHVPRSFIRPSSANPTWKHNKKTDPVTRHQMYKAQWNSQKAPGEKNHKGLRWSVREHMMYKDEMVQPRSTPRVYLPNTYVVPSDKKRQALRWAVRTQLAHREMPSTSFNF